MLPSLTTGSGAMTPPRGLASWRFLVICNKRQYTRRIGFVSLRPAVLVVVFEPCTRCHRAMPHVVITILVSPEGKYQQEKSRE